LEYGLVVHVMLPQVFADTHLGQTLVFRRSVELHDPIEYKNIINQLSIFQLMLVFSSNTVALQIAAVNAMPAAPGIPTL
jgi:hypothetical protein